MRYAVGGVNRNKNLRLNTAAAGIDYQLNL